MGSPIWSTGSRSGCGLTAHAVGGFVWRIGTHSEGNTELTDVLGFGRYGLSKGGDDSALSSQMLNEVGEGLERHARVVIAVGLVWTRN